MSGTGTSAESACFDEPERLGGGEHGCSFLQREKVRVARDEMRVLARGQGDEVVVLRVRRMHRRGIGWIWNELSDVPEQRHEVRCVLIGDLPPQSRVAERSLELDQEGVTDHHLELAGEPVLEETSRRTGS